MNAVVGTFTHTFTHMPLAPAVHTNVLRQSNRLTYSKPVWPHCKRLTSNKLCLELFRVIWSLARLTPVSTTGFADRKQLYLLYHYLNHYNLFGGAYYSQAEGILRQLTKKM